MALLEVFQASKSFGPVPAVRGVSLTAERGELVCLLGPSGCGKSTLLRLIAGLDVPDGGAVRFDGADLRGVAPHLRGFGLMFQDLALFPHMDVAGNVGFGLRMQGRSSAAAAGRVEELLELVGLAGYGARKIHELSGGERQRVALARSLAPEPKLLMLDEPLGSLDRVLRESLQGQLRSILKKVGVTGIYVTHDKDEAFAIADKIVVMNEGLVVQAGTPEELYRAPATELVARSLGMRNILPARLARTNGSTDITCALGTLTAAGPIPASLAAGADVLVQIDERAVQVTPAPGGQVPSDASAGVAIAREFRGGESELRVRIGDGELICTITQRDAAAGVSVGDDVAVVIPPDAVRVLA
jgi:ABC-type Fe3+/spermidine/putrescine transport system ATPase subunit